jgi:hypothetical protein
VLEGVQKIFSPFLLPVDLKIRVAGCDGMVNAFYWKQEITICYEYLDEIRQSIPRNMSMGGISSADAVIGQFFYVAAHEMGHAVFDVLRVPVFGREEDAADHFAVYMMLQFGREESRRLIAGAASAYDQYLARPTTFLRLEAFSGVHGLPMQRFFNLMCIAYGADAKLFADAVEKGYLPRNRANVCRREYRQVAFAFQQTLGPHLDRDLMKEVMSNSWLPPPDAPSSEEDESVAPQGVKGEARRGTP